MTKLRNYQQPEMYQNLTQEATKRAQDILVLVAKSHQSLRLRESNFYMQCALMHKLLQRVDVFDANMFVILCAMIFLSHKYEPTDGQVYKCESMVQRLFGKDTKVTKEQIVSYEEMVFQELDYNLVVVTAYDFIHLFTDCAQFTQQQANLSLYLTSLATISVKSQNYHPCKVAAAITMLVLQKSGQSWNPSLSFWSGLKPTQFEEERQAVLQLWVESSMETKSGKPSFISLKYKDPRKYQVSLEEPAIE